MGDRKRKGVWAIKSCPQMAGSGPLPLYAFDQLRDLIIPLKPDVRTKRTVSAQVTKMVSVQDPTPATKWHEGAKTDCFCRPISPTCAAFSSRPERKSRKTSTPERRYGSLCQILLLYTISNKHGSSTIWSYSSPPLLSSVLPLSA